MTADGLQRSMWASPGVSRSFGRPGDWTCPSCGFSNYAFREKCFQCPESKGIATNRHLPLSNISNGTMATGQLPTASALQNVTNFQNSNVPAATGTILRTVLKPDEQGLAESRWAPRNTHGKARNNNIWTRIVPRVPATRSSSNTVSTPTPDLGLPYEVQHYILAMIQRILEEACYEIAARWIPQKLIDNRWDCPEAVELSTWRNVLPTALPPNAIVRHPTYTLSRALADAVHVRNSAVHRHLCDNIEIRRMVIKAQDTMHMFADLTRRNKFHRLWVELNDWDRNSDHQTKKEKLLAALREISERPVDDMDWTPNSVSLEEVTGDVPAEVPQDFYHGEAMDLD